MRARGAASLLLSLAVAAAPLAAQRGVGPSQRGWIGVSFEILTTGNQDGLHTQATITDVLAGSPAQKAGLRPGDRLVSVNGVGYRNDFGRPARTLRPGDSVRIVVERDGRLHEVRLRAAALPPDVVPPTPTVAWGVSTDSMVDMMFRAMDSIRSRLSEIMAGSVRVVSIPGVPDSVFALRAAGSAGPGERATATRIDSTPARSSDSSETPGFFRPLTPYRLGRNWVAGAEMVDLRPGLDAYFRVRNGVLVVDVPQGTPAAMAGLRPGDVIVAVEGTPVYTIDNLRTGLAAPGDTLRLRVIRKGKVVRALLGR